MDNNADAYARLKDRFAVVANLVHQNFLIEKETEVITPSGSVDDRIQQMVANSKAIHLLMADPSVETWLEEVENRKNTLTREDRRNFDLMRRAWSHETALSEDLSAEAARIGGEGNQRHGKNRSGGDWNTMKDWYAHTFATTRTIGETKKEKLGAASAYDALLDQFSPGLTDAEVEREFSVLARELPALIAEVSSRQKIETAPEALTGPFPFEQQDELCRRVIKAMGFDLTRGRFDLVREHHPSSGGSPDYNWITSRFNENDFLDALFGAIHEAGHGMYEQNLPREWRYQPAGSSMGMAVHESQSMIWELQACKTPEFFQYLEREARAVFNRPDDPALSAQNLFRLSTRVKPSFIRVEADELTYPAHVVLRRSLEQQMIAGTLDVADLPQAWNAGMQRLLGITPPGNAQGCMQDVHWPCGLQGYFPAYTLGAMGAAQFFSAACRARPGLRQDIAQGNFAPLREWLRDNVHSKGSLLTTDELFTAATGETRNAKYYLNHLSQRYLGRSWTPAVQPGAAPSPRPSP